MIEVEMITLGALDTNCYLVTNQHGLIVIDPGYAHGRHNLMQALEGRTPSAIVLTHGHFDHIGAVELLTSRFTLEVYLHPLDAVFYSTAQQSGARFGLDYQNPTQAFIPMPEQEIFGMRIMHLPGHSPGSVGLYSDGILIGGDVLFKGGIGRYDLLHSNPKHLQQSLRQVLELPDTTVVYSGHGPATTVGAERKQVHRFIDQVSDSSSRPLI